MPAEHPIRKLLADPETYTTVLMAIVLHQYGTEALEWTPETIFRELFDDFTVDLPLGNKHQIVVGLNLLTSDDFYMRPSKFIQICNVLSGSELTASFDKADAAECAWGITEAALLAPAEREEHQFHPEILHYLGHVLDEEGIDQPPAILRAALRKNASGRADLGDMQVEDRQTFADSYGVTAGGTAQIEEMLTHNFSELIGQLALVPGLEKSVEELVADVRKGNG